MLSTTRDAGPWIRLQEAYVTIMEYIAGLDLMRVVTMEGYLEIDAVQVIMAQLILAVEHMHLRGFLHRDIKVSKSLSDSGSGWSGHDRRGLAQRSAEVPSKRAHTRRLWSRVTRRPGLEP
ncbi:hypothetical protein HPB47_005291 [Ixodes persulcatus]|uniref:Uncharacterized protein n=1 Tax=Ixodes persulcatus TaxID=34615 RepID=A0AC60PE97_IXOPE|nr:hypothetical protein HPB47_005291 [Ixodes persulcatus]